MTTPGGEDLTSPPHHEDMTMAGDAAGPPTMSFFITSRKGSANLGGLAGADAICDRLATEAGVRGKRWAAYLSAAAVDGRLAVNARDRIGRGPWYNAKGMLVAANLDDLHNQMKLDTVSKMSAFDEKGSTVPGAGDMGNEHDILTGSTTDGRVSGNPCRNWTFEGDMQGVVARVGHFDRRGGGQAPSSWNSAHDSAGCSAAALVRTAGAGRFYCFATEEHAGSHAPRPRAGAAGHPRGII